MNAPNSLMVLPSCPAHPEHGQMLLREPGTPEQAWCGVWYWCPLCKSGELFPSPELIAHNTKSLARAALVKATQP